MIILFIIEIFGEILLEVGGEFILSLGFESIVSPFKKVQKVSLAFAVPGVILIGAISALLLHLFVPYQLTKPSKLPGLSLVVAPFLVGGCMHFFGRWRASRGNQTTHIATFWGGATLAFTFALVRFLAVRYYPHGA